MALRILRALLSSAMHICIATRNSLLDSLSSWPLSFITWSSFPVGNMMLHCCYRLAAYPLISYSDKTVTSYHINYKIFRSGRLIHLEGRCRRRNRQRKIREVFIRSSLTERSRTNTRTLSALVPAIKPRYGDNHRIGVEILHVILLWFASWVATTHRCSALLSTNYGQWRCLL